MGRIRFHFEAGYVSDYSTNLNDFDCEAITFHTDGTTISLHAIGGWMHRFTDSGREDDQGYRVFREQQLSQPTTYQPPLNTRPLLTPADTFDYVVSLPEAGSPAICEPRPIELTTPEPNAAQRLLGKAPLLEFEPVGAVAGGGALSPLCDIFRPAFIGSRVTLTARDSARTAAVRAWFYFPQAVVGALRPHDTLNLTRTARGGLAVSVFRTGRLIAALGAVTGVPLGDLEVLVRRDQLSGTASRGEPPAPFLHPLAITTREDPPRKPRGYKIRVWYPAWAPPEDADECVSIFRPGAFPETDVYTATHLLAMSGALHIERPWHSRFRWRR